MTTIVLDLIPYIVLVSHLLLVFLVGLMFLRRRVGQDIVQFLGKHSILLGFIVSLGAIVGSLFYSEIIGFEACVLCWWQRVFLYPQALIFGVALWKRDEAVFKYVVPLVAIAAIIGAYQSYANMGWGSILPCTAEEGECSKVYVKAFGYVTIPLMSLTASVYILFLAWVNRIYRNENSHTQR